MNETANQTLTFNYIFDSYALLAFFGGERGADKVAELLENAQAKKINIGLSLINLGEILYIIERHRGLFAAQDTLGLIKSFPITILPAEETHVFGAAHIKARYPLSYADAFAVETARIHHAALVTGDPEFRPVDETIVPISWLR